VCASDNQAKVDEVSPQALEVTSKMAHGAPRVPVIQLECIDGGEVDLSAFELADRNAQKLPAFIGRPELW
jgi:hypothetical protein